MSHTNTMRVNPYTEIISGLNWGTGAGILLGACFGMTQDFLGTKGIVVHFHGYIGLIMAAVMVLVLNIIMREFRPLFSFVVAISIALICGMMHRQFAGDPMIIASIVSMFVLLYVVCFSLERHWQH